MCDSPVPFFADVPINEDILDTRIEKIAAKSLSDERHLKFEIVGTDEPVDLSKSLILLKMKIAKAGRGDLDDGAEVALIKHA